MQRIWNGMLMEEQSSSTPSWFSTLEEYWWTKKIKTWNVTDGMNPYGNFGSKIVHG